MEIKSHSNVMDDACLFRVWVSQRSIFIFDLDMPYFTDAGG